MVEVILPAVASTCTKLISYFIIEAILVVEMLRPPSLHGDMGDSAIRESCCRTEWSKAECSQETDLPWARQYHGGVAVHYVVCYEATDVHGTNLC